MSHFSDDKLAWSRTWRDREFLRLAAVTCAVTALIYFIELTSFTLSPDEALRSGLADPWRRNIVHARWGLALINVLLPVQFARLPFLPTLLFVLLLSSSAALLAITFTTRRHAAYAFAIVFACSPVWFHTAQINIVSTHFTIALLATGGALRLVRSPRKSHLVAASVLLAFATAVYQPFATLFVAGLLVFLIQDAMRGGSAVHGPPPRSSIRDYAVVTLAGALIYLGVNAALMRMFNLELGYVSDYVRLGDYADVAQGAVGRVTQRALGMLFAFDSSFVGVGVASALLVWLGAWLALRRLWSAELSATTKVSVLALSLALLLVAVALLVMSAGHLPTRGLICFPLIYALLAAQAFMLTKRKRLTWGLLGLTVMATTYAATALFYADRIARDRDFLMAARLVDRIEAAGARVYGGVTPLTVVGRVERDATGPALQVEVFGVSFFEQNGGDPHRIAAYLNLIAGTRYRGVEIDRFNRLWRVIAARPAWPADGSVFPTDNGVVIKLGEPSPEQRAVLQAAGVNLDPPTVRPGSTDLPIVSAASWGETHQSIQLFAPSRLWPLDTAYQSRAITRPPEHVSKHGGTLHFMVAVPQWVIFNEAGEVNHGSDGIVLTVQDAPSGREFYRLKLNPHANYAERKWWHITVALPPGVAELLLDVQPGESPDASNMYDQLLISAREPLVFRKAVGTP